MTRRFYHTLMFVLLLVSGGFHTLLAQSGGEMDHIDCLYSKEVIIPFTYSPDPKTPVTSPLLNQTVFYSYRDQFSYWYKIVVKENNLISFRVSAINDSDRYAVYVYQYNGDDFCRQAYTQKVKPVKSSFFTNGNGDAFDLSEKTFPVAKDNTYYICVLNISPNNCGHHLRLVAGKDTLRVKALHMPCKRELKALAITSPVKKQVKQADTAKPVVKTPVTNTVAAVTPPKELEAVSTPRLEVSSNELSLSCLIRDSKKHQPLDARYSVTDISAGETLQTTAAGKGRFSCVLQRGKSYKIKCSAFGYKSTEKTINPATGSKGESVEIEMEPLKEGDNFVMRSIYFYPNTYALKKESAEELNKLLTFLSDNETVSVEIQGHTNGDNRIVKNKAYESLGEEWNFAGSAKKLSQKRAEVIKTFLINNGIAAERLSAKGYGGDKPIIKYPETNEEGQRNIRVEIVILKE